MTDMNAFSTTHFHIPDFAVEKAPVEQQVKMADWLVGGLIE
jgi:hypothetical protein